MGGLGEGEGSWDQHWVLLVFTRGVLSTLTPTSRFGFVSGKTICNYSKWNKRELESICLNLKHV